MNDFFDSQQSAPRRERVIAVRVAFPDTAIPTVYEHFATLIPSDLLRGVNCLTLSGVNRAGSLATRTPHNLFAVVRNNVLIAFRHLSVTS